MADTFKFDPKDYVGVTTDTGHKGSSGSFGMLSPGVPDVGLQTDSGGGLST